MTEANGLPANLRILYVEEVAAMLRLSKYTTRELARQGKLGFRKAGKRYITTRGAVEAHLREFEER